MIFNPFRARLWLSLLFLSIAIDASAQWNEKVLYSFQSGTDGATPAGGVVFDQHGNLYGATQQGGGSNCSPMAACGTVYQLAPPVKQGAPWTETVLHIFKGKKSNDGEFPSGGVIADAAGNLYGTASYGGAGSCVLLGILGGCGTVFELSPPLIKGGKWTYKTLYSFKGGTDGYLPFGDLVFDGAGNLYGATYFGGGKGTTCNPYYQYCGTVFKLSPPTIKGGSWTEHVLHRFAGGTDGANPNGGLVLNSKGAVYGTTFAGANQGCNTSFSVGCGMVFALRPPTIKGGSWTEKVLHRFDGQDGGNSDAGVVFDGTGNLYGTTYYAPGAFGLVFELEKPSGTVHSWREKVLHAFSDGDDGANPAAGLVFDTSGNLYGTASRGQGGSQYGDVFRLKSPSTNGGLWTLTVLYGFHTTLDPAQPMSRLSLGGIGSLYGTSQYGGSGTGCGSGALVPGAPLFRVLCERVGGGVPNV